MKHGKVNAAAEDGVFLYWVLPDKPMGHANITSGGASWQDWDQDKTADQAKRYRDLLGQSCKGTWMETNHRYFFELEEDYEMFLIMCQLIV